MVEQSKTFAKICYLETYIYIHSLAHMNDYHIPFISLILF